VCEAGRAELLDELLAGSGEHAVVIARLELGFLREMNWPGTIHIETAIHRIGQRSLHVRQRLHQDDVLVGKATSVLAVIDTRTRQAVAITDAWRNVLERWLVPEF
jgi:acyl-CoA thioester hydrolase